MRVLIISANKKLLPDPVYPIGAAYLASICSESGHNVEAFDCNFKSNLEQELKEKIKRYQPDVIGISMRNVDNTTSARPISFLPDYQQIVGICRKYSDAKIVLGGSGYSLFPNEFFENLKPDYGVVGSAESTIIDLLKRIESGKHSDKIVYASGNGQPIEDVIPDRTFFELEEYYKLGGLISIQTQRGCTFKCSYCTYPYLEGHRLVTRQPKLVVDEIQYLKDLFNAKYFFIVDSVFNHSEKHLLGVCNELVKRNMKIKWSAYMRPKFSDTSIFVAMKESGCKSIELGTDALSEPTLKSFAKSFSVDDVFKFCEKCRETNIAFCHSLIFGAPGETEDTIKTTVKNVQETKPTAILAFVGTRILPNTPMAEHCLKTGFINNQNSIGIEPIFYVEPNLDKDWIFRFLKETADTDKRWIIPGVTTPKILTQKLMRIMNKRGLLWEFKKYATMGQRFKEALLRN